MTLLLDNDDLAKVIHAADFIAAQETAYAAFARGQGVCAPRIDVQSGPLTPDANYQLGLAVGMSGRYAALRIKSDVVSRRIVGGAARKEKYCVRPGTYMGMVLLFDASNGGLLAVLHDGLLQKMRVGADSALGVKHMARSDASVLGILGAGGMARAHVAAIGQVRTLRQVRVYSPNPASREAFAEEMRREHGLDVLPVERPELVYSGADIVSSCASAIGPMIHGRWLAPGMHVTCIGGTLDAEANERIDVALRFGLAPAPAELPGVAFDHECMTFAQAGGKASHGGTARYADIPDERRIGFAELLDDPARGRTAGDQITFSERGNIHGIQFAAVAGTLFERAREAGLGRELDDRLFLQNIRN